ncbi:hypothetical protein UlMin_035313 [Ulmus minor]
MSSSTAGVSNSSVADSGGSTTETDSDFRTFTGGDSPIPPDSSSFSEGEMVLAYHNTLIYPAKVIKIDGQADEWRYYVHYPGWNKKWDEWVFEDRLLKYTKENLQKQQELHALNRKQEIDKSNKLAHSSQIKPKVARGRKRKIDTECKDTDSITIPTEKLVLQIPPTLKKQLVDDCEFITHLGKLVKLPRTPNVDDILKKYEEYIEKKSGHPSSSIEDFLKGLHAYFNKALRVMLLYKSECQQYDEIIANGNSPSTVYGAEHLLRLFVKLPELLLDANIEEEGLVDLQQLFVDFLKFLQKNQGAFFLSTYHVPENMETSTNNQDAYSLYV